MLIRSSISNTKKLLQKTLQNFKSLFCQGYQKLPKTPPHNHFSCSVAATTVMNMELEKFYSDFTEQWDSEIEKTRRRTKKKAALPTPPAKQEENKVDNHESFISLNRTSPAKQRNEMEKIEECDDQENKRSLTHQRGKQKHSTFNSKMEEKLRELENLDMSNVDYVLDIEEVLHYYSRLTCPIYLEIVDKFFMEMYSEFLSGPVRPVTPSSVNSKMKLRSVKS